MECTLQRPIGCTQRNNRANDGMFSHASFGKGDHAGSDYWCKGVWLYSGEQFADETFRLTEQMVAYKPSMKLDFEAGRPLEIETMYWRPIAEAESAGYVMRAVRTLLCN